MKKPTVQQIKDHLHSFTEAIELYVNAHLKHDGDTSETSQRLHLINCISKLESAINGITPQDIQYNTFSFHSSHPSHLRFSILNS